MEKKIICLSEDDKKIKYLSEQYIVNVPVWSILYIIEKLTGVLTATHMMIDFYTYKSKIKEIWWRNPQACGCVANAIIQSNYFNHIYINTLVFEKLEEELKNDEPGIFKISLDSVLMKNRLGGTKEFPGHSFIIIKSNQKNGNDDWNYQLYQSYVGKYSLKKFINENQEDFNFNTFLDLKKSILDAINTIINNKGEFNFRVCNSYQQITNISISYLQGYYPDTQSKSLRWFIQRTSNKYVWNFNKSIQIFCNLIITGELLYLIFVKIRR